ncbi:ABC transporter ATP-binding protein [Glacieibacterium frigidum]|uniref:ABC transporter ATP-binding protein n=1 Tax=Glacieibacterium frigidum TaxID=2593303 RepID=A0A552UG46_9SPHN|nr:ABC transporter ATP-binding protein [Glacieibacterium frigidum]TRW17193.1 ABC transporter ATP-binding protein [Glacieibacterium frigidum]
MVPHLRTLAALLDRRGRRALSLIAVLTVGAAGLEMLTVALVYPLLQLIGSKSVGDGRALIAASGGFLALVVVKSVYNFGLLRFQEGWYQRVSADISRRLLHRYMAAPWLRHLERNTAALIGIADGAATWPLVTTLRSHIVLVTEGLVLVGVLGVMLWAAPLPMLVATSTVGGVFWPVSRYSSRRLHALGEQGTAVVADRVQAIRHALDGLREIRILGRPAWFEARYAEARTRDGAVQQQLNMLFALPRLVLEPLIVMAWVAVIVGLVTLRPDQLGDAVAVLGLFAIGGLRLIPSLTRTLGAVASIKAYRPAIEAISADLAAYPAATESPQRPLADLAEAIRIEGVGVDFGGATQAALDGVSLTIRKGQSIGIVGASGAGKSTLLDVMLGLVPPARGRVTIDGVDIASDLAGWQRQIAYVPQHVTIIDATLRANIAFGLADADIDDEQLHHIVGLAQLEGVVAVHGLDGAVGEDGCRLSGGERQRVGLARALYTARPVLILDEATSALDSETERAIGATLQALRRKRTTITVAHRLATVRACDVIVFMSAGRIVDHGQFDDLVARDPIFERFVTSGWQ